MTLKSFCSLFLINLSDLSLDKSTISSLNSFYRLSLNGRHEFYETAQFFLVESDECVRSNTSAPRAQLSDLGQVITKYQNAIEYKQQQQ